jgi:hypothetical protein
LGKGIAVDGGILRRRPYGTLQGIEAGLIKTGSVVGAARACGSPGRRANLNSCWRGSNKFAANENKIGRFVGPARFVS